MNIGVKSQGRGKSLPAELVVGGYNGGRRLMRNGQVVQQGRGEGLRGIGDSCYDSATPGMEYLCDYANTGGVVVQGTDPGFDWTGLTNVITAASTNMAKILAASNPGTMYRDPQGNLIYSQPTGNTQNLPVGGGGPVGTINTPLGNASFAGISSNTIMMVGMMGLLAVVLMSGRR